MGPEILKPEMTFLPACPLDHLLDGGKPGDAALILRDAVYSYQELNLRIGRMANELLRFGLQRGDRVASWAGKGLLTCAMPLAAARAGLIHVPINPQLKGAQAAHILGDSGAKLLIANAARIKALSEENTDCTVVEEKDFLARSEGSGDALDRSADTVDSDDLAALLYTSGSTGRPKGVMLTHANMTLGAYSVAQYLKLAADDVTLAVLPLSFDYGQNQLLSTWAAGGAVVPLDYLTPRDVIKACAKHDVTTLAAVPPLWVQLVEQAWPEEATRNMRRLTNSGGALTEPLVRALQRIFASADIYPMYGLTEAFRSTYLDPALVDTHPTSMGRAIPHAEILVVDAKGNEAKAGEPGELVHCGPLVAKGYWQDEKRTAERFKPAPAHSKSGGMAVWSGDTVKRAEDGLLYFVGRDDAMIKVSGNRISPTEVEEAAVSSGLIAEALAVGRPDPQTGAAIWLLARASGQANDEALTKHMKRVLPGFMQPAAVIWIDDFPKNPNGKIDRTAIITGIDEGEIKP